MWTTLGPVNPLLDLKLRRVSDVARKILGVGQHFAEAKDVMMHVSVTTFLPSFHELAIDRIARLREAQVLGHVCWDGIVLESDYQLSWGTIIKRHGPTYLEGEHFVDHFTPIFTAVSMQKPVGPSEYLFTG